MPFIRRDEIIDLKASSIWQDKSGERKRTRREPWTRKGEK